MNTSHLKGSSGSSIGVAARKGLNSIRVVPQIGVILGISAFVFYAVAAGWGMPYATAPDRVQSWGIDDESPLGPLTEIHNIIQPNPNQWLSYPLMYSFVAAAAYAPYMLFLLLTGKFTSVSAIYPFGLTDPITTLRVLTVIAHLVSAVMGALAVIAAFDIAHTFWGKRAGIMAALLTTVSFPLTYYARNGNVDAMAIGFLALAVASFSRAVVSGLSIRRGVWLGIFVGFTLATKESSIGVIVAMPLILLFLQARTGGLRAAQFWKASAAGAFGAVIAFGLGSGLFVDPQRYVRHVQYLRGLLQLVAASDIAVAYTYPYTLTGHLGYLAATVSNLIDAWSIFGLLLAVIGVGIAIKRKSLSVALAILALTYLVYLFVTYRLVQVRYLMPVTFIALLFVAYAIETGLQAKSAAVRSGPALLGGVTFGILALNAINLTYQMLFDSRYEAAAWLSSRTTAGDAIEYFGPVSNLPHLKAGIETRHAAEYRGMYSKPQIDDAKVNEIVAGWAQRRPDFVLIIPDHTNPQPLPYSHTVPPQLYQALIDGKLDYKLVAFFQTPSLFPWLGLPLLDYPLVNPPIRIFAMEQPVGN